jgi:putative heme-binding domain-containing protein
MPSGWPALLNQLVGSENVEVRHRALALAVLFGDKDAIRALRMILNKIPAPTAERLYALNTLLGSKVPDMASTLQRLLYDAALRDAAIRGLAAYSDPYTPTAILRCYRNLTSDEKADAIATLSSRPAYALALLRAVQQGIVPRHDLSAYAVRQLANLHNKQVTDRLTAVWGTIRPASQEKAKLMARYKALLTPQTIKDANRSHGRLLFTQTCASCHRLFGEGGDVGPELTGSQRHSLDYLLENILDPSAVVAKDYQVTVLQTTDGRVITGIIKQETPKTLTVQTQNEKLVLPKDEIDDRRLSPISMMPEGLLQKLTDTEVRDLIGYLDSPDQVPLPRGRH